MRWLLTLRRSDLDEVVKAIDECGGRRCDDQIPLGDTELTLKVEGPGEMAQRLRAKPEVLGVYPDSDLELH